MGKGVIVGVSAVGVGILLLVFPSLSSFFLPFGRASLRKAFRLDGLPSFVEIVARLWTIFDEYCGVSFEFVCNDVRPYF